MVQLQTTLLGLQIKTVENATHALQDKITRLHEDLLTQHQARLAAESATIYHGLTEHSQAELNVYIDALQLKSKQKLSADVDEAFPALYQGLSQDLSITLKQDFLVMADATKNDFKQKLDAELPAVEQVLADKVHSILNAEVPRIEQNLTLNVKSEIEKLLDSVRLAFNK